MSRRACLICGAPAVPGRSRCIRHGKRTKPKVRLHDSRQSTFRKLVLAGFTPGDPCGRCGYPIWGNPDAGHIIPLSRGGSFDPENGRPEHVSCNRGAGARVSRFFGTL